MSSRDPSKIMECPPKDSYNLAYIFFLLHGVGLLLPWNVFINAREYFVDYKLNTTISYDADYRVNLMSYFGLAAHFPSLCFAAWNTFYQKESGQSHVIYRFLVAMGMEVIVLLFTIILALIDTSSIPEIFFTLTIISVIILNACVGVHQTLTYGMAAILPMKYSNVVVVGSNACGIIISIVNIITKYFALSNARTNKAIVLAAVSYFLFSLLIVFGCIITFFWLRRLKFVRYYSNFSGHNNVEITLPSMIDMNSQILIKSTDLNHQQVIENLENINFTNETNDHNIHGNVHNLTNGNKNALTNEISDTNFCENPNITNTADNIICNNNNNNDNDTDDRTNLFNLKLCDTNNHGSSQKIRKYSNPVNDNNNNDDDMKYLTNYEVFLNCCGFCCFKSPIGEQRCRKYWSKYILTFRECWIHCLNIWCVFFCSLSMFPAVQSRVQLVDSNYFISATWFVDITCFLFFNLFAMLGCIISNFIKFPSPKYLWIPVWLRTFIFIPFFLFCNFNLDNPRLPVLIVNDHIYVFGSVIFALTSGYLASLGLMYVSRCCSPERATLAGMFGAFSLMLGVFTGVYTSRGFISLIF